MSLNLNNLETIKENLKIYPKSNLLIVTKNQSIEDIQALYSMGYKLFGENRVQEATKKYKDLSSKYLELHLIGPLQTNKVKQALKIFDVIQTIDRIALIDEISSKLNTLSETKTKEFYIQVNIGNEIQKSGVDIDQLSDIYKYAIGKSLNIKGLMCIPPNISDPGKYFEKMLDIKDMLDQNLKLSMGMSGDYLIALKYNSNLIRVGSLIFE